MREKMRLDKKYLIAVVCRICLILTSFLTTIFINRGLGVSGKGDYAYIINLVGLLYLIFSVGIGQSYSTFKRSNGSVILGSFVFLSFLHGLTVLLLGIIVSLFLHVEHMTVIIVLTSLAVVKSIISMLAVTENSIKRNLIQTIIDFCYAAFLGTAYIIGVISLKFAFMAYGVRELISVLAYIFMFNMKCDKRYVKPYYVKQIYSISIITMIVMVLISVNYSVDTLMLKNMSTSYEVGLYSVAVNFSNMFLLIPDSFKEVLFGDSTKKDFSKKTVIDSIAVSFAASLFILIGFVFLGKLAIRLFYGNDYIDSYKITLILFGGSLSMIFFKILQPVYISHGGQKKAAVFLTCSAIINIIVNYILIPRFAEMGAAVASAISYTVCGALFVCDYFWGFYKKSGFDNKLMRQ